MKPTIVRVSWRLAVLLMVPSLAFAQASSDASLKSAREFVQGFYEWYAPIASSDTKETASDIALKERRSAFSSELFKLLKEDSDAQARCKEIVGIDFDPFLFSQDPAERYQVGAIRQRGRFFRADVYGVQSGYRSPRPDVVAEFTQDDGHWTFVNFYSTNPNTDLLSILKSPRPKCTVPRLPGNADR